MLLPRAVLASFFGNFGAAAVNIRIFRAVHLNRINRINRILIASTLFYITIMSK
jgi:hypothetical protein